MRSKYVADHILKFMGPRRHPQYVHPKAQKSKFWIFFRKKFFFSIFQKTKVTKFAIGVHVWSGRSGMIKTYIGRIFWAKKNFRNFEFFSKPNFLKDFQKFSFFSKVEKRFVDYGAIKDFLNMKRSLNLFYDVLGVQKNYFGAGRSMCTHQVHFWKKAFFGVFRKF